MGSEVVLCIDPFIVLPRFLTPTLIPHVGDLEMPIKPTASGCAAWISMHFSSRRDKTSLPFIIAFVSFSMWASLIGDLGVPKSSFSGHTGMSFIPLDRAHDSSVSDFL